MGLLSKILNSFKKIRLNDKNIVSGQYLDYLLISSIYAEQQWAYLNSYETGLNKSDLKKIVETYWGVENRQEAIETLENLHERNQDLDVDIVYSAFENKENYVEILKSNLSKEEGVFEYYLDLYRKLNNIVPELIEEKVFTDFSEIRRTKDSAWNYGRGAFLSRCCYDLGYLSEIELKDYLEKSHKELKGYCLTWKEYTASYIFGRAIWGGSNNGGMIQIADDLLNNEKSPLKDRNYL